MYHNYCLMQRVSRILLIRLANRRLETRLNKHKSKQNGALYRHTFLTDHDINYPTPEVLATDSNSLCLQVK